MIYVGWGGGSDNYTINKMHTIRLKSKEVYALI